MQKIKAKKMNIITAAMLTGAGILGSLFTFAQPVEINTNKPMLRLNHIALQVSHLPTSATFYRDIVGLDTIPEPFHDGKHAWFAIGAGAQLHIIEAAFKPVMSLKHTHFCFSVPSVPDFVEKLKQKNMGWEDWPGVKGAITTRPDGVKQIYFQDPDGYWIEVNDDGER
jgi:lactoylglutathione lyase